MKCSTEACINSKDLVASACLNVDAIHPVNKSGGIGMWHESKAQKVEDATIPLSAASAGKEKFARQDP